MLGFLLGICCGLIELYLLRLLINSVLSGKRTPFWIPPVKMLVMIAFGLPLGWFFPRQLMMFALGAAGVLIIGSVGVLVQRSRRKTENTPEKEDCV